MTRISILLLLFVSLVAITGCGSGGLGGGVGGGSASSLFEDGTINYTVSPVNAVLSSTVGNAPTSADANTVSISVQSTAPNTQRKSPYTVKSITIKYTKMDDAKVVLTETLNTSPTLASGGSISIPVTIATSTIKDALLKRGFLSGNSWNFYVNASFTVLEDYSGKSSSYSDVALGTVQFK